MADFTGGDYLTVRSTSEVAASPRTLKALIEALLSETLPLGSLAAEIKIQNDSAGVMLLSHTSTAVTHYIEIAAGATHVIRPSTRLDLGSIYLKVATNFDPVAIEVVFE